MSRRASLFAKEKKTKPKVRFPDDLVFLDNLKDNDVPGMASMLRRVSVQLDINAISDSGMTPLHSAVVDGNLAAVKLLVCHGSDINKQDEDTWTPLHAACANGHADVIKFLLENGADKNIRNEDNERAYDLIDPQDFECVSIMLAHSHSVSSQDDEDTDQSDRESGDHVSEESEEEEDEPADNKWRNKLKGSFETLIEEKATENEKEEDVREEGDEVESEGEEVGKERREDSGEEDEGVLL